MCNEKDCKHEKQQPVTVSARDMKIGQALVATLVLRYHGGTESPADMAYGLFNVGACMTECDNPQCPHTQEYMHALVQAIDHVDNEAPLAAYEAYDEMLESANGYSIGAVLERLLGPVRGVRLPDMSAIVDTIIVDDNAGVVFENEDVLDDVDVALTGLMMPPDGILH